MININGINPLQLNIQQSTQPDTAPVSQESTGSSGQPFAGLSGGDTVTGQIMSREGNEVTLLLDGESMITAKLDISADLPVGSALSFTVLSSEPGGITLSPLLTNTDTSSALNTALMSAGLQIDERNLSMVESMMERGMNIGKEELARMARSLSAISDADIADGVTLKSLGINPTPENITQFHAYQGYEHQVSAAVNEIMDMLPDTLDSMIQDGDIAAAIDMTRDIMDIFSGQGAMEPMTEGELTTSGMEAPVNMILNEAELTELGDLLTENGIDPGFALSMARGEVSLNDMMFVLDDIINSGASARDAETLPGTDAASQVVESAAAGPQTSAASGEDPQTAAEGASHVSDAQGTSTGSAGLDFLSALKSGSVDADTLKSAIDTATDVNTRAHTDGIVRLIQSKAFKSIIQNSVNNQWKLTPDQVGEDKQVSDLYRRMTEQTMRLTNVLTEHAKADTPLAQGANELTQNMNFMNELNAMFNYVQLPMKMSGNDAHGELYVYSNKKHMASNDGNISALLHLDMDNLGPTDVYVTMNRASHVNTHFYLPDDEALDLIAAHIDELNERLEKRGYSATSEISRREDMTNIMNEIVEDNTTPVPISVSNFDARA